MSPPTWTSAAYETRVPPSMSLRVMTVPPRTKPGPPVPSTAMRYESGGCLSESFTLPSNVPFTAATPIFIVALYSSSPVASSRSQPGMAWRSMSGSRKASQTFWRGTGMSCEPSSFMARSLLVARRSAQAADGRLHAAQTLVDEVGARRVREPHVGVGAEVDARDHRHSRLLQQKGRHVDRAAHGVAVRRDATEQAGHVGERVERALRHDAAHAGNGIEAIDDEPAPAVELAGHLRDVVLKPGQC